MGCADSVYVLVRGLGTVLLLFALVKSAAAQPPTLTNPEPGSAPRELIVSGERLYFIADDGLHGEEFWALDEDERPYLVYDLAIGPEGSSPENLLAIDGGIAWLAQSDRIGSTGGSQVWYTAGGPDSTRVVASFPPDVRVASLAAVGSILYFLREESGEEYSLWKIDVRTETEPLRISGTSLRLMPQGGAPSTFGTPHGLLLPESTVGAQSTELRFIPAGEYGSRIVPVRVGAGPLSFWSNFSVQLAQFTDSYCVSVDSGLYRVDLPSGSATLLTPREGTVGRAMELAAGRQGVYFQFANEDSGSELWHTSGSAESTREVCDVLTGPGGSEPYWITPLGEGAVFVASRPDTGSEIWYSPGPERECILLRDLIPGPRGSDPYQLCALEDVVLFSCYNDTYGEELWVTDGTPDGTRMLRDISPGSTNSEPYYLKRIGNVVYFVATTAEAGEELWRSDGSEAGTYQLPPIRPEFQRILSSDPRELTRFGEKIYFSANSRDTGRELFESDGTREGTKCSIDLNPGEVSSNPHTLFVHEDWLYFATSQNGNDSWWRIGVASRTADQVDAPPARNSAVSLSRLEGGLQVFQGWSPETGSEPWIRDEEGQEYLVADLVPGPASSSPREFAIIGNKVYFRANSPHEGTELFVTDGTRDGTMLVRTGIVYYSTVPNAITAFDNEPAMLVRHAGSYRIDHSKASDPKIQGRIQPNSLVANDKHLFFVVDSPAFGKELWSLQHDTSHNSSHIVKDILH